jgi:hypothetical protein
MQAVVSFMFSESSGLVFFFKVFFGGEVKPSPLVISPTIWLIVLAPDDNHDECGSSRWNENWQGKPVTVPLCPPQIPHDLTWNGTCPAAVRSRRLIA